MRKVCSQEIQVEQLQEHVWCFEDAQKNSFYMIEGSEQAVVIDTGMAKEDIVPFLRQYTSKPLILLLTHAHIDHMFHCDEFSTVYIHKDEQTAWKGILGLSMWFAAVFLFHVPAKRYPVANFHPLVENDTISLGDTSLRILRCAGHTSGSIVVVDDTHKLIFSGDAFGSGTGVFLWTPASCCISLYQKELQRLQSNLKETHGYVFLGGHRTQGKPYTSKEDAHVLSKQVILDTEVLCKQILTQNIKPAKTIRFLFLRIYWYTYQSAGMATLKKRIR